MKYYQDRTELCLGGGWRLCRYTDPQTGFVAVCVMWGLRLAWAAELPPEADEARVWWMN